MAHFKTLLITDDNSQLDVFINKHEKISLSISLINRKYESQCIELEFQDIEELIKELRKLKKELQDE